jgi:hypothetical protein
MKPFELSLIAFQNILASITYSILLLALLIRIHGWPG